MGFESILFPEGARASGVSLDAERLADLRLDRVIDAVAASVEDGEDLRRLFATPVRDLDTVAYRQEVMRDLEDATLLASLAAFCERMRSVRRFLESSEKASSQHHRQGWHLEAALEYCSAVEWLHASLQGAELRSRGLAALRDRLAQHVEAPGFRALAEESREVKQALAAVSYVVVVESGKFKVRRYEGEPPYSETIEAVFEKFRHDDAERMPIPVPPRSGTSHIDAAIVSFVARLYPEPFAALDRFCAQHASFVDDWVVRFDWEVRFYLAYRRFADGLAAAGLPFCYPVLSAASKRERVVDAFDAALAAEAAGTGRRVVLNGYSLDGVERALVVTGPNQGGKTTFARMFGQLHHLAMLGCPVPGRAAELFAAEQVLTHFERREDAASGRSKLEEEVVRLREVLDRATPASVLVLNEVFTSTTVDDALDLSRETMRRLLELDVLCVWVTFLDEIASMDARTVSMVAQVDPEDPAVRTFKVLRVPADGRAYALALARKHRLTYDDVVRRVR